MTAPYDPSLLVLVREPMTKVDPGDYGFIIADGSTATPAELGREADRQRLDGRRATGDPLRGRASEHFDFGIASSDEIWVTPPSRLPGRARRPDPRRFPCRAAARRKHLPGRHLQARREIDIHSTKTVDYVIVVSGELTLVLEDREIMLTQGDVVVSLAAPHGWANRGETDCVAVVILLRPRARPRRT